MKCNECLKELNEMSLYCDRCGAQVSRTKMPLTYEEVEKQVLPIEIETPYGSHHQNEIRNAFFLSNIRKDFRGAKRVYIEQYIDYVLLLTYYMKNRIHLTTTEFAPEKALALLNTFYERKPDPKVFELLEEEYGDDYTNRVIPKTITDRVEKLYLSDYKLSQLNPTRLLSKTVIATLKGMVKVSVIFALIGALLYVALPMLVSGFNLISFILNNPINLGILIVLLGLSGYIITSKQRKYLAFEDIINTNDFIKKQIRTDIKKKIKTLKYRIKKSKK